MKQAVGMSPQAKARLAAALYLISGIFAGFAVLVLIQLVAPGDPSGTAANILGSESLFRLGFVADTVSVTFVIAVTIIFYDLFKPVNRSVALLASVLGIIGNSIQGLNSFNNIASLLLLKKADGSTWFTTAEAQGLALLFLELHSSVFDIALIFFGLSWILFGYLIAKSTFLPRLIGAFVASDGFGYLTISVTKLTAPLLAAQLYPYLPFATVFLGEGSLMVWLLVKGVNAQRWIEQGRI